MQSKTISTVLDQAVNVRRGEELDAAAVDAWLKLQLPNLMGAPEVTQYSGGASNWTYCLDYPDQSLILRRAPAGTKAKGAHNMEREFKLQQALKPVFTCVPEMLAFCGDESVLGTDFYVMEKLNGVIPRKNFPRELKVSAQQSRKLCENMFDRLIDLHNVDVADTELAQLGKAAGYIDRQIDGWSERFTQAKTWNVPSGRSVMRWLSANKPASEKVCLIHNDYRLDNLVLDAEDCTHILGVLDWELATLGDPLMDLGNTLAYWVEANDDFFARSTRRQPSNLEGMFSRQEVVEYYCQKTGHSVEDFAFYEVYGLFRLAGIVQQIYYRYHHKQSDNPAFKNYWLFVHYLFWRCNKIIRQRNKNKT